MKSMNDFGLGFISVFIPAYLLQLGYSLVMVMQWYIIQDIVFVLMSYLSVYCSNKIGLVNCLQIRFVFLVSYLVLTLYLPSYSYLFYLIPILIGLEMAFFWIPLNILFVRNTKNHSMGQSLSQLTAYPKILTIFSPVIGAFIAVNFGFSVLFTVAILIVLVALTPIFSLRSERTHFIFDKESMIRTWKENKRFFVPEIVSSFVETGSLILMVFIYIKLLSVTQIGYVGTISALASVFFTISIGKLTDLWNKHKLIKISAMISSLVWVYCFYISQLAPNPWLFYIATFAMTLITKAFVVPYQSLLFNNAKKSDAQFLVFREIPNIIGRIILYCLVIVFAWNLSLMFLFSALVFVYFWFYDSKRLDSLIPVTS
ncbi:MAG: hypothetical protein WAX44_02895 [Minisyncoccia bacterium]